MGAVDARAKLMQERGRDGSFSCVCVCVRTRVRAHDDDGRCVTLMDYLNVTVCT